VRLKFNQSDFGEYIFVLVPKYLEESLGDFGRHSQDLPYFRKSNTQQQIFEVLSLKSLHPLNHTLSSSFTKQTNRRLDWVVCKHTCGITKPNFEAVSVVCDAEVREQIFENNFSISCLIHGTVQNLKIHHLLFYSHRDVTELLESLEI
jgi:hypothetical protein